MSNKVMFSVRLQKDIIALLKQLARDRGVSQAVIVRELILREVYK